MSNNEWDIEPNKLSFIHSGLHCLIQRNETHGFLNAYVSVPESNIYYGVDYDDLNSKLSSKFDIEVTFSEFKGTMWTFGISFSSVTDYIPNDDVINEMSDNPEYAQIARISEILKQMVGISPTKEDYKNIEYAIDKIQSLAEILSNKQNFLN